MHWPQIVMIIMIVLNLFIALDKHGEPQPDYNFFRALIGIALAQTILYFGGFWG